MIGNLTKAGNGGAAALRGMPAFFVVLLLVWTGFSTPARAAGPRLVILAVDRMTLDDLRDPARPNLGRLLREGSVGLMTTRSLGGLSPEKIYLSIGAGDALADGAGAGLAVNAEETWQGLAGRDAYRLATGMTARGRVLHLGLAPLARANVSAPGRPGKLGAALAAKGWRLAVLGNADRGGNPGREAVCLVMDGKGTVALGDVGPRTLRRDWRAAGGWRTDYGVLSREFERLGRQSDLLLVVLGDLARVHAAEPSMTPARTAAHLRTALSRLDRFVGRVLSSAARPDRIMLLVASPPLARIAQGERLTPFVIWGRGVPPGLCTSDSTRRAGVITPYDITASIAAQAGLDRALITTGRPIESRPGASAKLAAVYAELIRNYRQRPSVLFIYGYLLLAAFLGALVFHAAGPKHSSAADLCRCLLASLAVAPAFLLFLGLFRLGPVWLTLVWLIVFSGAGALLFRLVLPAAGARLLAVCLCVIVPVMVDVLLGSPLLIRSLMGYSPIFGARFYGLGNEYLGVVLGASIVGASALLTLPVPGRKILAGAALALIALLIAAPRFGANIGGGISAVIGFGYAYLVLLGRRVGMREALLLLAITAGMLILLVFWDLWWSAGHLSHLGQAVLRMRAEGAQAILGIIRAKLAVSLRILAYTPWTWILLGVLVLAPLALRYPPRFLARFVPGDHPLLRCARGLLLTAVVGLLVNDSGIVVAATIIIHLGLVLAHVPWRVSRRARGEAAA
ncbi:MAG: hypothetical protein ACM3X6_14815 [Patescibacteria group bacterium]